MDTLTKEVLKIKLIKDYPNLIRVDTGDYRSSLTTAAKNVRIELKVAFPGVKFSVKTERYSGGDSISVGWIDGPTGKQVEAITKKYQGGSFNGMEDIYEYTDNPFVDLFGEAKYVFGERERSNELIQRCLAELAAQGYPAVTVEEYRSGRCGYGEMDRTINLKICDTVGV